MGMIPMTPPIDPKVIGRAFYRELHLNGFTVQQIVGVATELLVCLQDDTGGTVPRTPVASVLAIGRPDATVRILARTFYRELKRNGIPPADIVALVTEMISQVTDALAAAKRGSRS